MVPIQALVLRDVEREPGRAAGARGAARRGGRLPGEGRQGAASRPSRPASSASCPSRSSRASRAARRSSPGPSGPCGASSPATRSSREEAGRADRPGGLSVVSVGELAREALAALRAHTLRSFLTLLGIIIGVATLVGVVSVITGLNAYVRERVIQLAPDVFVVHEVRDHPQPRRVPRRAQAPRHRLERLRAAARRTSTSPRRWPPTSTNSSAVQAPRPAPGRRPRPRHDRQLRRAHAPRHRGRALLHRRPRTRPAQRGGGDRLGHQGRAVPARSTRSAARSWSAARRLPGDRPRGPAGADPGPEPGQPGLDPHPGLPARAFGSRALDRHRGQGPRAACRASRPRWTRCARVLRALRHTSFRAPDPFGIVTAESLQTLWRQISAATFILSLLIASVSLGVGGIVIMNIMLVAVVERTREIGVRLAARRAQARHPPPVPARGGAALAGGRRRRGRARRPGRLRRRGPPRASRPG